MKLVCMRPVVLTKHKTLVDNRCISVPLSRGRCGRASLLPEALLSRCLKEWNADECGSNKPAALQPLYPSTLKAKTVHAATILLFAEALHLKGPKGAVCSKTQAKAVRSAVLSRLQKRQRVCRLLLQCIDLHWPEPRGCANIGTHSQNVIKVKRHQRL